MTCTVPSIAPIFLFRSGQGKTWRTVPTFYLSLSRSAIVATDKSVFTERRIARTSGIQLALINLSPSKSHLATVSLAQISQFSSNRRIINPRSRWFNRARCSHSAAVEAGDPGRDDEGHLQDRGAVQRGKWREPDLRGSRWQAAPEADVVPREHRDRRVLSVQHRVRADG